MEFDAVIGLEIHIEMNTKSKMFSSAPVAFGGQPNTRVFPLDMAFPGAMPVINKQAVINAIRVCNALHMTIDNELWFDRKNYFYSDLAKGYQITQHRRPLGRDGYLDIGEKRINIDCLIIEEDTCKQIHYQDWSLLDYNRSGIPLIEIVCAPELNSGEEAKTFVEQVRSIVTFLGVSNGKMEEGCLRCDVNVSIKEKGNEKLGEKVEIKNINTLNNIKNAVDYEIKRQIQIVESGKRIIKESRRYDEGKKETIKMRLKTDSIDYKYFTEPNLVPIKLSQEFIEQAINTSPELAEERLFRYQTLGLSEYDAKLLIANKETSDYFDETISLGANPKLAANWINVDIQSILKKNDLDIKDFSIQPKRLSDLLKLIEDKRISNKQARELFKNMLKCSSSVLELLNENTQMLDDEECIKQMVNKLLDENINLVNAYKNGKDRIVGFVVGQLMKNTNGNIEPSLANKIVREELQRR